MELQENGLPLGAEFVKFGLPDASEWLLCFDGSVYLSPLKGYLKFVIIKFPTYGKPLEQVDLKGSKLLGGNMKTAYKLPNKNDWYIDADGTISQATCDWWLTDVSGPRICLEPPPKKRRVLVVECEAPWHNGAPCQVSVQYHGERIPAKSWTIKEVEDGE